MTCRLISTQRHTHLQPEYILRPSKTRVGRHPDNHIVVMLESISRFHAEFEIQDDVVLLRDLGSRNGTYLNGHRIRSAMPARSGDRVQFGNVEFIFRSAELSEEADRGEGRDDTQVSIEKSRRLAMEVLSTKRFTGMVEELAGPAARARADFVFELYQISLWLREHASKNLDGALVELLDRIFRVVPASRGAILRRDAPGGELKPIAWQRQRQEKTSPQIAIPHAITEAALTSGEAVLMGDALEDERFKNSDSIAELEISSAICAPLTINKEVSGVIYLDNQGQDSVTFTDIDLAFVGSVAQELAFAMRAREVMAEGTVAAGDALSDDSASSKVLLGAVAKALGSILEGDDSADRATVALESGDLEEARRQWRVFRRTLRRLDGMLREMREFVQPPAGHAGLVNINDVLLDAIEAFEDEARAKGVEIRKRLARDLAPAKLDEEGFYKAALAVLLNAADAVSSGEGVIQVNTYVSDKGVLHVEFQDNGPGFDDMARARLFQPYNAGPGSQGSGMGLALAKRHIERMGGNINIKSEPGKGAKIAFQFPPSPSGSFPAADD